jgi:hypothetical protein
MKVSKFVFVLALMLFASGVFAQTTHMGVTADNMVVLEAICSNYVPNAPCDTDIFSKDSKGNSYERILPDGTVDVDFKMPARKVLVITDYEWTYTENTVLEDSAKTVVKAASVFQWVQRPIVQRFLCPI